MNILLAFQQYVNEMIHLAGPGMKVLLLDKETTSIISCVYAQSEMMQKEVYLFERIDSKSYFESIKFLKCIVFLRPTVENVQLLSKELKKPKYGQYYIYFSNIISKTNLKILAESDEQETVREVHEFYFDFVSLAPHLCTLNIVDCYDNLFLLKPSYFQRFLQAIVSILLSLKKKAIIRYQSNSKDAIKLSNEIKKTYIREDSLFKNCKTDAVILIIDRSKDPVSPLLNQWTYEAMVHELIGIENNRVTIKKMSLEDKKNIVLSAQHDEFYAKNLYLNFGDIGQNIKALMNNYQKKALTHQKLESINDMKKFVKQYPQFKKISRTVSKHVHLVGELSQLVKDQNLLEISEMEQNIVNNNEHLQCFEKIKELIRNSTTTNLNALRLTMLYALKFETYNNNNLKILINELKQKGLSNSSINSVQFLLKYSNTKNRQNDVFGNQSAMEMTKKFIKGLKGVENIYTQHEPYIIQLIDQISQGCLSESLFLSSDITQLNTKFENVIVFIIGGCTYEESAFINSINAKHIQNVGTPRVILCSNYIHNTKSFIQQLMHVFGEFIFG